jgi:hypothetical protein
VYFDHILPYTPSLFLFHLPLDHQRVLLLQSCFLLFIHLFICAYIVWAISPLCPLPLPFHLASKQNLEFCWREDVTNNKKDTAFLLVSDKDSYTDRFLALLPCTCVLQPKLVHLYQTSSLLPGHLRIVTSCQFKITLFTPLQWAHQTLSCFEFPTIPYSSCMCSPLSVWPMSNYIYKASWSLPSMTSCAHPQQLRTTKFLLHFRWKEGAGTKSNPNVFIIRVLSSGCLCQPGRGNCQASLAALGPSLLPRSSSLIWR